jgi:hypothetical protein
MAAGVGSRIGLTIEDIDDLKIAVDELCAYLTGTQGREVSLRISFTVDKEQIEVKGVAELGPNQKVRTELTEFSRQILSTVADSATLEKRDGIPTFTLTKRRKT